MPHSFYIKTGIYAFETVIKAYLDTVLFSGLGEINSSILYITFPLVLFLSGIGCGLFLREDKRFVVLLVYPVLVYLAYAGLGAPPAHQWEVQTAHTFVYLFFILGAAAVLVGFFRWLANTLSAPNLLPYLAVFFSLFVVIGTFQNFEKWTWEKDPFNQPRSDLYLSSLVPWIQTWTDVREPFVYYEIGMLGYRLKNPLYDTVGLVNPSYPVQPFWEKVNYLLIQDWDRADDQIFFPVKKIDVNEFPAILVFHKKFPGSSVVPALERFYTTWTKRPPPGDFRMYWTRRFRHRSDPISFSQAVHMLFQKWHWAVPNEYHGSWVHAGYSGVYERNPTTRELVYWAKFWDQNHLSGLDILNLIPSPPRDFYVKTLVTDPMDESVDIPSGRQELATFFIRSFFEDHRIQTPSYSDWEIHLFLDRLYDRFLDRKPDTGGIATWKEGIQNGTYGYNEVALLLLKSGEVKERYRSRLE